MITQSTFNFNSNNFVTSLSNPPTKIELQPVDRLIPLFLFLAIVIRRYSPIHKSVTYYDHNGNPDIFYPIDLRLSEPLPNRENREKNQAHY